MTIAIADLAQSLLICNMYQVEFEVITNKLMQFSKQTYLNSDKLLTEGQNTTLNDLERITKEVLQLIDHYLEKYARSDDIKSDGNANRTEPVTPIEVSKVVKIRYFLSFFFLNFFTLSYLRPFLNIDSVSTLTLLGGLELVAVVEAAEVQDSFYHILSLHVTIFLIIVAFLIPSLSLHVHRVGRS